MSEQYTESLPSLIQLRRKLQQGRLSAEEILEQRWKRIAAIDQDLLCFVRRYDRQFVIRTSPELGRALDGLSIGIKDIIDEAGVATNLGMPFERQVARSDAAVVGRLKRRGAISIGKTATAPYACFDPPQTRNPWNVKHTPGGSSSGSAAAVAAGMVDLAIGTQTGGSIIRPAAFCGVVGFKPARGRLSLRGIFPVSRRLDHAGLFAQLAESIAYAYQVVRLPAKLRFQSVSELDRFRDALYQIDERPPFFVLLNDFQRTSLDDRQLNEARQRIIDLFGLSVPIRRASLPFETQQAIETQAQICAHDVYHLHAEAAEQSPARYPPGIKRLIRSGSQLDTRIIDAAHAHQAMCRDRLCEWLSDGRVLVTPATPGPAPADLSTTGDPRNNSIFSLTGVPAVTVPCGNAPNGLPLGIQLIAHPRYETKLLAIACRWDHDRLSKNERLSG